jgi:hypothetical protein
VRKEGNNAAHTASKEEIKEAIETLNGEPEHNELVELYEFLFRERMY